MTVSPPPHLADFLSPNEIIPQEHLGDYPVDGVVPQAAVRPVDRENVSEILRWASANEVSVFPRGGGTQLTLGNVPDEVGIALDLSGQTRVLDYQPADLTTTVESGITLNQLQLELAAGGKFLPLEAPLAGTATIGGILAANTTGPLRFSYGQPRDWLIGIRVVSGAGVETKAGGKVVKNVTGYDLNKLYTGSLGSLGVIVEATFKLSPLPTQRATLMAGFPSFQEAIKAGRSLLQQIFTPIGVQILDTSAAQQLNWAPANTLASHLEANGALTIAFFSGRSGAVRRKTEEGFKLLRESGAADVTTFAAADGWSLLESLTGMGLSQATKPYLGIKITTPPSAVASVADECQQVVSMGLPPGIVADPGYGVLRLFWWSGSVSDWIDDSLVLGTILRIRELARGAGGSTVVEHCPLSLKKQIDVWGGHSQGIDIMRSIKKKFDPQGILNPGRFVGRI